MKKNKATPPGGGRQRQMLPTGKRRWLWPLLSLLIAACTILAVIAQGKSFSPALFAAFLARADRRWLLAAAAAMLGFILFEACALRSACRALQYPGTRRASCLYAAADIFFSAITPSATGGQPACALLMMRSGIPGTVTTAVLLLNLAMYSLAILLIGLGCLLLRPGVFLCFGVPARVLIVIGYVIQLGLALLLFLLVKSERLLERICSGALRLLGRLRLLRNEAKRQEKLRSSMEEYRRCAALLAGQRGLLIRSFIWNFLQRASQISVTLLVFLAMGGSGRYAADLWAMQSYVVIGSNCAPVPGAMGVADYLMLDGFSAFLPRQQAVLTELLSRSLSFYCCILLCGVMVLVSYRYERRKDETHDRLL